MHFPLPNGNPGIARSVPGCKNEAIFWDCVAQQVRIDSDVFYIIVVIVLIQFVFCCDFM